MAIIPVISAIAIGLVAVFVVYCVFVVGEIVHLSRGGPVAVGIGVLFIVLSKPSFWITAAFVFAAALLKILR